MMCCGLADVVEDVFKIGSVESGAVLFDAFREFEVG